jgi:CxxC motif-containing protein (DUF1111 family)
MRTLLSVRVFVSLSVTLFALTVVAPTIWSAGRDASSFVLESNGFAEEFCANQSGMSTSSDESPEIPDGVNNPEENECNFEAALEEFTGPEGVADGLGPVYNAAGCGECHGTPMIGGSSQVVEKRAGFLRNGTFFDPPGGSLIQDRSTDPRVQELVPRNADVVAFRASLSILGLGFVEAIDNATFADIQKKQPADVRGRLIHVPVLEAPGQTRVGRFGWKNQQASLLSFSADAYVNEMGITSPMQPDENSFNGNAAAAARYDDVPAGNPNEVDDEGIDVALFALFMRSTQVPPRDVALANTRDAVNGSRLFDRIGCATCHTRTVVTARPGTSINGGTLKVGKALGSKTIHPFSDFLLHDVGTGDGIVQNGGQATRNMLRTVPLWGLRARGRFMHDLQSLSLTDAIKRHGGQAAKARQNFDALSRSEEEDVLTFLMSL